MHELDADGDHQVDEIEFGMWWQDNGGEKFRPRAPPGPGDMSRKRRFELRKLESKKKKADAAKSATADSMSRLDQRDGNGPPAVPERPQQQQSSGATFEIEQQQHTRDDTAGSEVTLNPLSEGQQAANRHASTRANGHGWSALRTGQPHHALFDGPFISHDASHIARRAAAILKPMPVKDHSKMTRHESQRAHHGAALDRRVEQLLMGAGAKISHQTSHGNDAGGLANGSTAAAPVAAPRPLTAGVDTRAGSGVSLRVAGAAGHFRAAGGSRAASPPSGQGELRPPPVPIRHTPPAVAPIAALANGAAGARPYVLETRNYVAPPATAAWRTAGSAARIARPR